MSASVEQRETPSIFLNIREGFLNTRERSTGGSADLKFLDPLFSWLLK